MLATDHSVIKDVASFFPQLSHYSITLYRVSSAFVIVLGWRRGRSSARDGISSRSKPVKTTAQLTERWKDLCGTAPNDDEKQGEDVRLSVCTRREKIPHTFSHRRIGSWKLERERRRRGRWRKNIFILSIEPSASMHHSTETARVLLFSLLRLHRRHKQLRSGLFSSLFPSSSISICFFTKF